MYDRQLLVELGLGDVTHTRRYNRGPKPGITTPEILSRSDDTVSKFVPPTRIPTNDEKRMMIKLAIESLTKISLENHIYSFNGEIRLQSSGGAIGDSLTGAIGSVFVLYWSRKLKEKLLALGITPELFQIYIDDQQFATKALPPGTRFLNEELIIVEDQIEHDMNVPADLRTARIFQAVSNSICEFLQVTIDCPSQHESGYMPVLDIQVKMENNKIKHKFYKKPIASKKVILANSALPGNVKRASLTEGALRRLRYTDRSLPWQEVADILSEYSNELRLSGYDHGFRAEIMEAALVGFRRQCARADSGGTPLFRSREFERQARRKRKLMSRESWFRPANNMVCFIPSSGELAAGIQQIVREEGKKIGLNIRVAEQSGTKISALLTSPDLSGCLHPRCDISEEGASHSRRGANYSGTCIICGNIYHGETGFGAHTRVSQHKEDIRRNNDNNSMAAHLSDHHPEHQGDPNAIIFSVNKTGPSPLLRQVREACKIANTFPTQVMNSRAEYLRPVIQRLTHTDLIPDDNRNRGQGA